ncbi:hypothetical protein [Glaciecola sp. SC05]|uniref:hypothetical protein n=1 Tax=Glaciecola sp. SC05 TaxID=1987355 RepID=UPI0035296CCF
MFKRNQLYVSLFAATMVLGTSTAMAQESVSSSASIVVQNAFDLTEVAPLDFGTVRATVDSDPTDDTGSVSIASFTLGADGSTGSVSLAGGATTVAALSVIANGTPAEFAIANASPFTTINISSVTAFDLVNTGAAPGTAVFGVSSVIFREVGATANGTTVTTDIGGAAGFTLGATLSTDDATSAQTNYADGTYSGTFVMQVSY